MEEGDKVAGVFNKSGWDIIAALYRMMSVEVACDNDACRALLVLYSGCDGVFYYSKHRHC